MSEAINAFCVDVEEWFHVCGFDNPYSDPSSWDSAPAEVVEDTEIILSLLDEVGAKGTFLTVGWVAEKYPQLVKRIADGGHEVGCHGYHHKLVFEQTPAEFEEDLVKALTALRAASGQPVRAYRAPGFSMTNECLWAYPILARHGITIDTSIVPAPRSHGGMTGVPREPFLLRTEEGNITCFPVSVLDVGKRTLPFSGGGYLRLFPLALMRLGFWQNHRAGIPGMSYIHPREVNPHHPRMRMPMLRDFKYHVNLASTVPKLRALLAAYPFTTVADVLGRRPDVRPHVVSGTRIVAVS